MAVLDLEKTNAFSRLEAKRREQTPQALARLVVICLFVGLWSLLWLIRIPMPLPFLVVLVAEIAFFVMFLWVVSWLPTVRAIAAAQYTMLGAEIVFHTTMVYFLGGIAWLGPFAYVFGLIFTNAFLDLRRGLIYTTGACAAFVALVLLEATGAIPHYVFGAQGPLRYSDAQFVTTALVGAVGVFYSIYLWSSWVGHQLRRERDTAVRTQDELLAARGELQRANAELEQRVAARTGELEAANTLLRESEQRLQLVLETCPDLIAIQDTSGVFQFANSSYRTVLGYPAAELIGRSPVDLIHPDDLDGVREIFIEMVSSRKPGEASYRMRHALGHWVTLESNGQVLVNREGEPTAVVVASRDVTERRQAEAALRESEATLRATIESTADGILVVNETGKAVYANERYGRMWRMPRELLDPLDRERMMAFAIEQLQDPEGFKARIQALYRSDREDLDTLRFKDGRIFERYSRAMKKEGAPGGRVWSFRDITERERAEEAVRESEATLKATIESTADGILVVNEAGKVVYANERFATMWRIPSELLSTRDDDKLLEYVLDQLVQPEAFLAKVHELYQTDREDLDTLRFKDGRAFERYSRPLIVDGVLSGRVWSFRDITERKRAEEALHEQARRDPLTGLLNRRAGLAAVDDLVAVAKQTRGRVAVLVLDLDRFKLINDRRSHETGDAALCHFAELMTEAVGDRGVVCRLGGDEFEIALRDTPRAEALRFGDSLRDRLKQSLRRRPASRLPQFTVSIGIASYPEDGETSVELGRYADEAMYAAKAAGGDASRPWRKRRPSRAA